MVLYEHVLTKRYGLEVNVTAVVPSEFKRGEEDEELKSFEMIFAQTSEIFGKIKSGKILTFLINQITFGESENNFAQLQAET